MTVNIDSYSVADLGGRCAEEASKRDAKKRDDRYCYELVRRAFGLQDGDALNQVFNVYVKIWSKFWIRDPRQFDSHPLTADDFISITFNKVYSEIKGDRFVDFPLLNPFLAYLHITLRRVVAEYLRRQKGREEINSSNTDEDKPDPIDNISDDDNPSDEVEKRDLKQKIYGRVRLILPDEKVWALFQCRINGMSRAEIIAAFPHWWPDENTVRVDWQRILRKLGSDPGLGGLLDDLFKK